MDDGYVRVGSSGVYDFDTNSQAIEGAARLAAEQGCKGIMFDIRNLIHREYHVTAIRHVKSIRELGIKPDNRIAVLGKPEDAAMLEYFETISLNRGVMVKSFTDEEDAIAWLKN